MNHAEMLASCPPQHHAACEGMARCGMSPAAIVAFIQKITSFGPKGLATLQLFSDYLAAGDFTSGATATLVKSIAEIFEAKP